MLYIVNFVRFFGYKGLRDFQFFYKDIVVELERVKMFFKVKNG